VEDRSGWIKRSYERSGYIEANGTKPMKVDQMDGGERREQTKMGEVFRKRLV
jgi:hypothetical protein